MPRRRSKLKDFLAGGASGAMTGASFGPKGAIAGALIGGTLNALQSGPDFDPSVHRQAFQRVEDSALRRSTRMSREIGTAGGSEFAARGISGGLSQGVIRGQQRFSEQATLDRLAEMEYQLEMDIANAQAGRMEQERVRWNNQLTALATQGSTLAKQILNPDPFTQDAPGILRIREALGIETPEKVNVLDYFNIDGRKVPKQSGLGALFSMSQDFVEQLAKNYSGGMDGLFKLLEQAR